jgi:hypothetical protein
MLIIRDKQREAFIPIRDEARIVAITGHLQKHAAEACHALNDAKLRALVAQGIADGSSFGLRSLRALAGFVGLSLIVGPRFFRHSSVRAVLEDPSIPPEQRVQALVARLSAREWRAAQQQGTKDTP